jgi:hypothetical protein
LHASAAPLRDRLRQTSRLPEHPMQSIDKTLNALASMPGLQAALVILFFAFSVIAGNAVLALHYRRVGKPVLKSIFSLGSFPLADFNAREWLLLAGVFAISMAIVALAALLGGSR